MLVITAEMGRQIQMLQEEATVRAQNICGTDRVRVVIMLSPIAPVADADSAKKSVLNKVMAEALTAAVVRHYGITEGQLFGRCRKRPLPDARAIYSHIAYANIPGATTGSVGSYMGGRDHSTVLYYNDNAEGFMQIDKHFRNSYNTILISFYEQINTTEHAHGGAVEPDATTGERAQNYQAFSLAGNIAAKGASGRHNTEKETLSIFNNINII